MRVENNHNLIHLERRFYYKILGDLYGFLRVDFYIFFAHYLMCKEYIKIYT